MRKKRAVFAVLASLAVSLFILFGCGPSSTSNKVNADVHNNFVELSDENLDTSNFMCIVEDKQTGVEYIVVYRYSGVSITPRLNSSGKPVEGP